MVDLSKSVVAANIKEDLKKITNDLQKHDPEIPDTSNIPLGSKENFKDLIKADLGKTKLPFEEELKKKVESRKVADFDFSQTKKTEEKIDNHAKLLEELKQKQKNLESRKKELEARKANPNITREERWKIAGELEGISKQFINVEKETKTIHGAASREAQFNNKNNSTNKSNEPTAADIQQQGAMAAIKRMKEEKSKKEKTNKNSKEKPPVDSKSGVIPPPPPMPGSKIPVPPTLLDNKNNTLLKEVNLVAKHIPEKKVGFSKELENALKNRTENRKPLKER